MEKFFRFLLSLLSEFAAVLCAPHHIAICDGKKKCELLEEKKLERANEWLCKHKFLNITSKVFPSLSL